VIITWLGSGISWLKLISGFFCLYRNLHGNNLIGTLPRELGELKYLRVFDLGMNQLIGPIPPEFGNLTRVEKM